MKYSEIEVEPNENLVYSHSSNDGESDFYNLLNDKGEILCVIEVDPD